MGFGKSDSIENNFPLFYIRCKNSLSGSKNIINQAKLWPNLWPKTNSNFSD